MNPNDFSLLRRNLCETYRALHTPESQPGAIPLIACAQTLTYTASWRGRWIQLCQGLPWQIEPSIDATMSYTATSLFNACILQKGYKAHHLRIANWVKAISQITQATQQDLTDRYNTHLKTCFGKEGDSYVEEYTNAFSQLMQENSLLDDNRIIAIRHMITACSETTQVFWRFFLNSRHTPLTEPLEPFLKNSFLALENKTLYRACKNAQRIVDLEGIIERDIPVIALSNLSKNMAAEDEFELEKWIRKLNAHKSKIPLKSLMSVLREVVTVMQIAGVQSVTLDQILMLLDEKGCEILKQDERKHLIWRQRLHCRSAIVCNGKSFKLGNELGNKVANNAYRLFNLEDHPHWLIKIARNTLQLKIEAEKVKEEKWHWGVHLVKTIGNIDQGANVPISGLDKEGKCVIIEKLKLPLNDISWTSSSPTLIKEEETKALAIANHVYVMHDQMVTPEGLCTQHLMFDSRGALKALRPLKKGVFNYNALENFCLSVGNGNPHVTDFIMRVSQLSDHPVAEFYRGGVEYVLQHGETNNLSRAQNSRFERDIYATHLELLCTQALALRTACVPFVRDHLMGKKGYEGIEEELEQRVYDQLAKLYKSSSTPGTLNTKEMMQLVLQRFLDKQKKIQPANNYYNDMFLLLKKYNLEALGQ